MKIIKGSALEYIGASHELSEKPGSWKKILFSSMDAPDGGHIQMINWAKIMPGDSFRSHYHEDMDEYFIITQGIASLRIGEETASLEVGDAVRIFARETHTMKNISDQVLQYVVIGVSTGKEGKTVVV